MSRTTETTGPLEEMVKGSSCDWCGGVCDPEASELNALSCSFAGCPPDAATYHQDCLERFLKSVGLDKCVRPLVAPAPDGEGSRARAMTHITPRVVLLTRRDLARAARARAPIDPTPNVLASPLRSADPPPVPSPEPRSRKVGFKCPRGCGKASAHAKPCPGTIQKSHPIIHKNRDGKKRRKALAAATAPPPEVPRYGPEAKARRAEERASAERALKERRSAEERRRDAANERRAAERAAREERAAADAEAKRREQIAAAASRARRELGLEPRASSETRRTTMKPGAQQTLVDKGKAPASSTKAFARALLERQSEPRDVSAAGSGWDSASSAPHHSYASETYAGANPADTSDTASSNGDAREGGERGAADGADGAAETDFKIPRAEKDEKDLPVERSPDDADERIRGAGSAARGPNTLGGVRETPVGSGPAAPSGAATFCYDAEITRLERSRSVGPFPDADSEAAAVERREALARSIAATPVTPSRRRCVGAVLLSKAASSLASLLDLGFPERQCRAAVLAHGSDVARAAESLFTGDAAAAADRAMRSGGDAFVVLEAGPLDVGAEIAALEGAYALGAPESAVNEAVCANRGDPVAAAAQLYARGFEWWRRRAEETDARELAAARESASRESASSRASRESASAGSATGGDASDTTPGGDASDGIRSSAGYTRRHAAPHPPPPGFVGNVEATLERRAEAAAAAPGADPGASLFGGGGGASARGISISVDELFGGGGGGGAGGMFSGGGGGGAGGARGGGRPPPGFDRRGA